MCKGLHVEAEVSQDDNQNPRQSDEHSIAFNLCRGLRKSVYLFVMAVSINFDGKTYDTLALLDDDGSQSTPMRREFFDKIEGFFRRIFQTTIKDDPQCLEIDKLTTMVVSYRDGSNSLELNSVLVQPDNMFNKSSASQCRRCRFVKVPVERGYISRLYRRGLPNVGKL